MEYSFLLLLCLAFAPSLMWLCIFLFKDRFRPEPLSLIAYTFMAGMVAAIPFLGFNTLGLIFPQITPTYFQELGLLNPFIAGIFVVIGLAFIEEFVKHFAMLVVAEHHEAEIDQVIDGVIYGIAAAVGFAFIENTYYFFSIKNSVFTDSTLIIFGARALGTTLLHCITSGLLGYFYAKAHLQGHINKKKEAPAYHFHKHFKKAMSLHVIRVHWLSDKESKKGHDVGEIVVEGLLVATAIHALFNLLVSNEVFGQDTTIFVVPLIMAGLYALGHIFTNKVNHRIAHHIKSTCHGALCKVAIYPTTLKNKRKKK